MRKRERSKRLTRVLEHGAFKALRDDPDFVDIRIGAAFSEKKGRFRPHWVSKAAVERGVPIGIKVFVRRKKSKDEVGAGYLPKSIEFRERVGRRLLTHRVPIDVVALESPNRRELRAVAQVSDAGNKIWPSQGVLDAGNRFFVGNYAPNTAISGLVPNYRWIIGTVGCIAGDETGDYIVTAGHVVGNPYAFQKFKGGPTNQIAVAAAVQPIYHLLDEEKKIVPDQGFEGSVVIDCAAIRVPDGMPIAGNPTRYRVATAAMLEKLSHCRAYLQVERANGGRDYIYGTFESMRPEYPITIDVEGTSYYRKVEESIMMRFDGSEEWRTSMLGDSGGPIFAETDAVPVLLGFHYAERRDGDALPYSLAIPAYQALQRAGLRPRYALP